MLILHFLGLAMGVGTAFAHAFMGPKIAKLTTEEVVQFNTKTSGLGVMGGVGLVLLIISGVYLLLPFWSVITYMPLLIVKLSLVLLLIILIAIMGSISKKGMKQQSEKHFKIVEMLGKVALLISVSIVVVAVVVF